MLALCFFLRDKDVDPFRFRNPFCYSCRCDRLVEQLCCETVQELRELYFVPQRVLCCYSPTYDRIWSYLSEYRLFGDQMFILYEVAARIDVRVGRLKVLVHLQAILAHPESRVFRNLDVRMNADR